MLIITFLGIVISLIGICFQGILFLGTVFIGVFSALIDNLTNKSNGQFTKPEQTKSTSCSYPYKHHKAKDNDKRIFTDEEILALGLYPKDEGYKMHLISNIINK